MYINYDICMIYTYSLTEYCTMYCTYIFLYPLTKFLNAMPHTHMYVPSLISPPDIICMYLS